MAARPRLEGTPSSAQEAWFDAILRHQITLLRFSRGLARRVNALLDATEGDLRRLIRDRVAKLPSGQQTPASLDRLNVLLGEVEAIRSAAHAEAGVLLSTEMRRLAVAEPGFLDGIFKTVIPVRVTTTLPDARRLRAIVTYQPFAGDTMKGWLDNLRRTDVRRIEQQIRIGLVQGEDAGQIARRVVGATRTGGRGGVTALTRRDAETIVLTTANGVANTSAQEWFRENAEFFDEELFVATLDSRTTPVCRATDGERFPIGEGRIPPLHPRCRSRRVPILDEEALGKRPYKAVTERQLLREFAKREGLDRAPRQRKGLPYGTKGRFDDFARRRTRELIGRTPAKTTYEQWLRRQSKQYQEDVLGKAKAQLFRRGDLSLDKFIDRSGAERTLSQIARSDRQAFIDAGLDPEDFLR